MRRQLIVGKFALSLVSLGKLARARLYLNRDDSDDTADSTGFAIGSLLILWRKRDED